MQNYEKKIFDQKNLIHYSVLKKKSRKHFYIEQYKRLVLPHLLANNTNVHAGGPSAAAKITDIWSILLSKQTDLSDKISHEK